jgi:hypothetical protein
MSDAAAIYYSSNSAQASVNHEEGATDIEEIDVNDEPVPQTIITRVDGKGTEPRHITWPVPATPSISRGAATNKSPGPTTEEALRPSDTNPVEETTTTKSQRKPPGQPRAIRTPASPPSVPPSSGSRASEMIADLDAVYQSVLGLEDNSDDDDLLDLAELKAKNKRRRRRQARKIRRLHDMMRDERRRHEEVLRLKSAASTTAATSSKDRSDQKSYTVGRFDGNKSIGKLVDDLRVETLARSGWDIILNVKTEKGKTLSILEHSAIITEKEMENSRRKRTPQQVNDGRNLYVATWRSLTTKPKHAMEKYAAKIMNDGPSFLYYLLRNYAGTATQIVRTTLKELDNLPHKMEHSFRWDVDKYTTYVSALLVTLSENGGKDNMAFDKSYEVLTHSPCQLFNSEIVVYKQVHASNLDINNLLVKAREEYLTLTTTGQWVEKDVRVPRKEKREKHSDIAALFASKQNSADKIKSLKRELRQSRANLALKQNGGQKASKAPKSNSQPRALYSWEEQYGPGKSFETREEFFEWLYKQPAGSTTQKKNGLVWHFCKYCKRNVRHESKYCPKKASNKGKQGARSYAASLTPSGQLSTDDSSAASVQTWSEDEKKPVRKSKSRNRGKKVKFSRKRKATTPPSSDDDSDDVSISSESSDE